MNWLLTSENPIPENEEILIHDPDFIDEDYNPKGIKIGFKQATEYENDFVFYMADWNNEQDCYDSLISEDKDPDFWMPLPEKFKYPDEVGFTWCRHIKTDLLKKVKEGKAGFGGVATEHHLQVLVSPTGFYIGTLYYDTETNSFLPNSRRSSEYFTHRHEATKALIKNCYARKL